MELAIGGKAGVQSLNEMAVAGKLGNWVKGKRTSIIAHSELCFSAFCSGDYAGQSYLRRFKFCGATMQSLLILMASNFECKH